MKNQKSKSIETFASLLLAIVSVMLLVAFVGTAYFFHGNLSKERTLAKAKPGAEVVRKSKNDFDVNRLRSKLAANGYCATDNQP